MEKIIMTPEEEAKWFLTKLDCVTLEMSRGVFKVIFSYSNKKRRCELRIFRENNIIFYAEGVGETPIRMLEEHAVFLKIVAHALREASAAFFEKLEKGREKREEEQEEEEESEV
jgi:hypothetical protein